MQSWASPGEGLSDNFRLPALEVLFRETYMYGDVDGLRELCDNTADDDQLRGGLSLLPALTESIDEVQRKYHEDNASGKDVIRAGVSPTIISALRAAEATAMGVTSRVSCSARIVYVYNKAGLRNIWPETGAHSDDFPSRRMRGEGRNRGLLQGAARGTPPSFFPNGQLLCAFSHRPLVS